MGWEDNIIGRLADRIGEIDSTNLDRMAVDLLIDLRAERDDLKARLKAAETVISEIAGASWGTVADIPMAHRDLTIGRAEAYIAAHVTGERKP